MFSPYFSLLDVVGTNLVPLHEGALELEPVRFHCPRKGYGIPVQGVCMPCMKTSSTQDPVVPYSGDGPWAKIFSARVYVKTVDATVAAAVWLINHSIPGQGD